MGEMNKEKELIISFIRRLGYLSGRSPSQINMMSGDGSDRIFYRVEVARDISLIAVLPSPTLARGLDEQAASFRIGVHLHGKNVPVPEIVGYDKESGLVLFKDLGNLHLQAIVLKSSSFKEVEPFYQQAIEALIRFQLEGAQNFDVRFCWDTPRYDMELMLNRESDYFRFSFCRDYMGKVADDPYLLLELQNIARRAAREPADFLLHRDFQSRNLLVQGGKVYIIDYQGARFGPLGYDLASLLLDPYSGLNAEEKDKLFLYYCERISHKLDFDQEFFREGYHCLAIQRNLQILGAFAFLSQIKGKKFFEQFILPALLSLMALLQEQWGKRYISLTGLVDELIEKFQNAQLYRMDE